jgi:hypothetical protein
LIERNENENENDMTTTDSIPAFEPPAHFPTIPFNGEHHEATVALFGEDGKPVDWALCGTAEDIADCLKDWGCSPDAGLPSVTFSNDLGQTAALHPRVADRTRRAVIGLL